MARREPDGVLDVTCDGGVATLTLFAGAAGPCLTPALHAALAATASELDLDDELRAVVLCSRGAAFCRPSDADASASQAGVTALHQLATATADGVAAIAALRVPVLCLLQGDALDEGLELALACDLRFAAPRARLGLTQLERGRLPRHGGTQRLPRLVGRAHAQRMLLLGERITARRAVEIGLVQGVVPSPTLWNEGARAAAALAARGPIAQRLAKEALRAALDLPLAEGLRLEGDLYVLLQSTRDRDEGIASFRERRRPRFTGR